MTTLETTIQVTPFIRTYSKMSSRKKTRSVGRRLLTGESKIMFHTRSSLFRGTNAIYFCKHSIAVFLFLTHNSQLFSILLVLFQKMKMTYLTLLTIGALNGWTFHMVRRFITLRCCRH